MIIDVLSLFPEFFQGPFDVSIIKRAKENKLIDVRLTNLRDFAEGKHRKVDDRPFGGGPGMVLKPEPVTKAIRSVRREDSKVIYLSPQGKPLNAQKSIELAKCPHLILLCGHYEGIDERIIEKEVDEEISIGDYVLTSGCIAAVVLVDAVIRFIPGVLGHEESAWKDSFQDGMLDAPNYTKPVVFEDMEVPPVLREGDHQKIAKWRKAKALEKTYRVRRDLIDSQKE